MRRLRAAFGPVLLAGCTSLFVATALLATRPAPVHAAVTHDTGFRATVLGWSSWYGSYGMGSLGTAWCIDHGSRAPDPSYQYVRTDLPTVPADTRAAMAWTVGRWGSGAADRISHAAVMLVLHDLMGAAYPSGPLDVDALPIVGLAGFQGHEATVVARARAIKADALAHQRLRGTLRLTLDVRPLDAAGETTVRIALRDDAGRGAAHVGLLLDGAGAGWPTTVAITDGSGVATVAVRPTSPAPRFRARTIVPRLTVDAWQSSSTPAQRVVRPSVIPLLAEVGLAPPPTTTTAPTTTTSTTVPPTTTTSSTSTTSTTVPPPSTTSTTATPPTTTPPTTTPPTTTPPTAAPPPTVLGGPPSPPASPAPSLPRTGRDALTWVLYGTGLVLIGLALVQQGQPSAPRARRSAMRASS
jgi:hypothetical protein